MSDAIHRFLWGYGSDGYCVLARSAGLPSELTSEVRALLEPCSFSERRPSFVSSQLDGYFVLCSANLRQQPGKRASWERAFVLVPIHFLGTAGLDRLLQLLPDSSQRGELPVPPWPPPPEQSLTLETDEERSLAVIWAGTLRGQSVFLQGFSPEEELRLCQALWQRVPPEHRRLFHLALGLSTIPASELRSTLCSVEEPPHTGDVVIFRQSASTEDDQPNLLRHFYAKYVQPLVTSPEPTGDSRPWWLRWSESVAAVLPGSSQELCRPVVFSNVALADWVAEGRPFELAAVGNGTPQHLGILAEGSRIFITWLAHRCRDRSPAELFRIVRALSRLISSFPGESSAGIIARMGTLLLEAGAREALAPGQDPGSLAERLNVEHTAACLLPETPESTLRAVHAAVWNTAALLLGKLARQGNRCVVAELQTPWPDAPRLARESWLRRLFSRSPNPDAAAETPASVLQRWLEHPFEEHVTAMAAHFDARMEALSPGPESPILAALLSERGDLAVKSLMRGLVHTAYAARRLEQRELLAPAIQELLHNLYLSKNRTEPAAAEDKSHAP